MNLPQWLNAETHQENRYWFRGPVGLEQLLGEEIREDLPVDQLYISHRNVFVALNKEITIDERSLRAIRTADDVYRYLGCCYGIDRTRPGLENLTNYFQKVIIPVLSQSDSHPFMRITLSFVGRRNYSRYFVEDKLNALLSDHTSFTPLNNEAKAAKQAGELRLRCHIEDETAFWGLGLDDTPLHRRSWRHLRYDGQLHTPVAATMARALNAGNASLILDPFCGSGTILIESALKYPDHQHIGFDISEEAIGIAQQSAALAKVSVDFVLQDTLISGPPSKPFLLLSNPPWDEKHEIGERQMEVFIQRIAQLIQASAGGGLLLPEAMILQLDRQSSSTLQRLAQTRIRGKMAWLIRW